MKKLLTALLACTVLTAPATLFAQDLARDILNQPSMTSYPEGKAPAVAQPPVQAAAPVVVKAAHKMAPIVDGAPAANAKPVDLNAAKAAPAEMKPANPALEETAAPAPVAAPVKKDTQLADILGQAYTSSPTLRAEREVLRRQYENVAQADSNWRPYITASGGVAIQRIETKPGGNDNQMARDIGLTATQYVYRGGRTLAQVEQQLKLSDAAYASYMQYTQETFLNVITAAMDVQATRATIDLNEKNREVIAKQLKTVQNAFTVGELTRTDVSQAQARLSGADASVVAAKAQYSSALARFLQYAGVPGDTLVISNPAFPSDLPQSIETAQSTALSENPVNAAAKYDELAAHKAVALAEGALLPEVALTGQLGKSWDPQPLVDTNQNASLGLRATVPLYEAGYVRSQVRQAKIARFEKADRVEEAARAVQQAVSTAWNNHDAAKAQILAREKQVSAATVARDGVYKEREVGTRTVLDTLDADAELLDAQVALVQAHRDAVVTGYALLAATGQLTSEKLGFSGQAQEKSELKAARGKIFSTSVAPRE